MFNKSFFFFFWFNSSEFNSTLVEIVNGYHNDVNCEGYQEEHKEKHGKATQLCKFKDQPEKIANLMEKILIKEPKQDFFTNNRRNVFKRPRRI